MKKHRTAAIYGGMAGLVFVGIIVAWGVYGYAMTPAKPNVRTASAKEMVTFTTNSRGLSDLPRVEQEKLFEAWHEHLTDPAHKQELAQCLSGLDDEDRKTFTEVIMKYLKRRILDDARAYTQIKSDSSKRYSFLKQKVVQYSADGLFMKDLAVSLKTSDFDSRPEGVEDWAVKHTTPEERALGEPYLHDLQNFRIQWKKEQKGLAEAASRPATP